jgi:hypothetical protein
MTALMCDSCILLVSKLLSWCWVGCRACWSCWVVGVYAVGWKFVCGGVLLVLLFPWVVAWFVGVVLVRDGLGVGVGIVGMLLWM